MGKIWIIGAGSIAEEYAKVLKSLNKEFLVIGRGLESATRFKEHIGVDVVLGGLDAFLSTMPKAAESVIIATPLKELASNTMRLLLYGVKNIFCEKPGFMFPAELKNVLALTKQKNARVFYAYNRRFFASVIKAQEMIEQDGGVKSFNFEFTEWGHVVEKSGNAPEALANWFYANSSHVVDLAFFLGGNPILLNSVTSGEVSYHKPAIFAGSGITDTGALFSYGANWSSPGRWGIEVLTSIHRFYLRPMEMLQIQNIGSIAIETVEVDDSLDKKFKPGFYLETKSFIEGDYSRLCSIDDQFAHLNNIYYKIMGV